MSRARHVAIGRKRDVPLWPERPRSAGARVHSLMNRRSSSGSVSGGSIAFNGIKIFSATMFADRERLGDKVTDWIGQHPRYELKDIVVTQSSDASFHCIAITVFYRDLDAK